MAGVCPKCVTYDPDYENDLCPGCGTPLLSPQDWKTHRKFLVAAPNQAQPAVLPEADLKQNKDFILGFFLGVLLFFFAFLSTYLVWGDRLQF